MPLDAKTAAKIAKEHGLTLSDARAIRDLAADETEAVELAEQFGNNDEAQKIADRIIGGGR